LGHVSTLRRERRRAFHVERRRTGGSDGEGATNLADLERHLADLLEPLAHKSPEPEKTRLTAFVEGARRSAQELDRASVPLMGVAAGGKLPVDPVVLAELLTERYLEIGDVADDEATLDRMQSLAGDAISRLAWLRDDLPELRR
jgi:hypothetical protein